MENKLSLNRLIHNYILFMFVYLSFEPIILNITSAISVSVLPIIRFLPELLGYGLVAIAVIFKKEKYKLNKVDLYLLVTFFIGLISSVLYTSDIIIFIIGLRYFFRYIFIYILVRLSRWGTKETERVFQLLRSIMVIEIFLAVWQLVSRETADLLLMPNYGDIVEGINSMMVQSKSAFAVYSSFGRYNMFGYFITVVIWYLLARRETLTDIKEKKKNNLELCIWIVLLILSYSRQTLVAIFIGYIIYSFYCSKISFVYVFKRLFVFMVIGLVVAYVSASVALNIANTTGVGIVSGSIVERYLSMFNITFFFIDYIGYGRTWFISEGILRLLSENPLLGYGLGMYGCPDTIRIDYSVYQNLGIPKTYYMDVFIGCIIGQVGLLGFVTYMLSYKSVMKKCLCFVDRKTNNIIIRQTAIITFGVIVSSLIMMMFSSSLSNRLMGFYLWLFIGIFVSTINKNNIGNDK